MMEALNPIVVFIARKPDELVRNAASDAGAELRFAEVQGRDFRALERVFGVEPRPVLAIVEAGLPNLDSVAGRLCELDPALPIMAVTVTQDMRAASAGSSAPQIAGGQLIFASIDDGNFTRQLRQALTIGHQRRMHKTTLRHVRQKLLAPAPPAAVIKREKVSESLLASIVEYSEDAIITTNTRGVVTSWNAGSEKLYGWTSREIIGKSIARVIPESKQGELLIMLGRIKRNQPYATETSRLRKTGPELEVSVIAAPIIDPACRESVLGMSLIERDITERRTAESKEKTYIAIEASANAIKQQSAELQKAYESLKDKTLDLERFHRITMGREARVMELKTEVNELLEQLNLPKRYKDK